MRYLLFQHIADSETPLNLPAGLHIEVITPSICGVFQKENTWTELGWKYLSFGRCWLFKVKDEKGTIVHQSMAVGKNPKFCFLKDNECEIGPCWTLNSVCF